MRNSEAINIHTVKDWNNILTNTGVLIEDVAPRAIAILDTLNEWRGIQPTSNQHEGMMLLLDRKLTGYHVWFGNYRGLRPTLYLTTNVGSRHIGLECDLTHDRNQEDAYIRAVYFHEAIYDVEKRANTSKGQLIYIDDSDHVYRYDLSMNREIQDILEVGNTNRKSVI